MSFIGAGAKVAVAAGDLILNYSKDVYEEKISKLKVYVSKLNTHLNNLEKYKEEVRGFWTDGESLEGYLMKIQRNIIKIKNAITDTENMIKMYQEIIDDQLGLSSKLVGIVGDIGEALDVFGGDD
jgi:prefoldin subunit 5